MHSYAHHNHESGEAAAGETRGLIMNWGWRYDLMVWFFDTLVFRGRLKQLRRKTIELAQLHSGDAVLDVGCGTGTLAIMAKERVGTTGRVCGIDPGAQQIARARSKVTGPNRAVDFQVGVIERLAFADASFDAVTSTMMMHHLPDDLKRQGLAEILRVLKPGGRLAIADFNRPEHEPGQQKKFGAGEMGLQDLATLVKEAGFSQVETGDIQLPHLPGIPGAGFVSACKS
jgi:ubiquinone/menaquinone biosynthesis C-methylase UbiE